jgi:hypothetical protein
MEKLFSFLLSFVLIAKSSRPNTIEWVCSDRDVLWVNRKPTRLNGVYILKSVNNSVPFPCQDSPGSSAELQTCSLVNIRATTLPFEGNDSLFVIKSKLSCRSKKKELESYK